MVAQIRGWVWLRREVRFPVETLVESYRPCARGSPARRAKKTYSAPEAGASSVDSSQVLSGLDLSTVRQPIPKTEIVRRIGIGLFGRIAACLVLARIGESGRLWGVWRLRLMRAVTVKAARFVITTPTRELPHERLTPESPALPVEGLAQWDREPSAIPVRMLGHQPLERFEIFNGQPAPLN
jgi:hypothetical protein